MKKERRILTIVFLLIAIALFCVACSKDDKSGADTQTATPAETAKSAKEPAPTKEAEPTDTPAPTKEAEATDTPAPTKEAEPTDTPAPTKEAEPTAEPVNTDDMGIDGPSTEEFTGNGLFPDMTAFSGWWDCTGADMGYLVAEDGSVYPWYSEGDFNTDEGTELYASFTSDYEVIFYYVTSGEVDSTFTVQDDKHITDQYGTVFEYRKYVPESELIFDDYTGLIGQWDCTIADTGYLITDDGSVFRWYSEGGVDWGDDRFVIVTTENTVIFSDSFTENDLVFDVQDYDTLVDDTGTSYKRVKGESSFMDEWYERSDNDDWYDDDDSELTGRYLGVIWAEPDGSDTPDLIINFITQNGEYLEGDFDEGEGGKVYNIDVPDSVICSTVEIMGAELEGINGIFNSMELIVFAGNYAEDDAAFICYKDDLSDYYMHAPTGVWYYSIPINWDPVELAEPQE